jgi:transposase-like protein
MPSRSASQYVQAESQIAKALSSVSKQPKPNLSELARQFGVSYDRLRWRYLGKPSRSTRKPAGKKLTELQESEILNRISQLDHQSIKRIANQILERDHFGNYPPPTVGNKWCQRFIKRHGQQFKGELDFVTVYKRAGY